MAKGKKTGGRKAGTPNKYTAVSRDVLNKLTAEMFPQIMADIASLEPENRVKAWLKVLEFCISKPQTVSLDMAMQTKKTIEDRLAELSGDDEDE